VSGDILSSLPNLKINTIIIHYNRHSSPEQEAQLLQRGRATMYVVETLKCCLEITQGHLKWYQSKAWVRFPIAILQQLWPNL